MLNEYVPTVLVIGDAETFRARVRRVNRPVRVFGSALFRGEFNGEQFDLIKTKTFRLGNKIIDIGTLKLMVKDAKFDYIVFMNYADALMYTSHLTRHTKTIPTDQVLAIDTFLGTAENCFHSFSNDTTLYRLIVSQKFHSMLDADSYLAGGARYIKPMLNYRLNIDCIGSGNILPIFTNIYARVYSSPIDCCFRHYDAILLTDERDWESLLLKFCEFSKMTDNFIVFVREGSPVTKLAKEDRWPQEFIQIHYQDAVNGTWYILKYAEKKDIGLYVVTHKKYEVPGLPPEYISIHAGRALGDDLGYVGDDSGKSISELNRYLNEMTAAYWIWKNTTHDYVGISHYRRFFANKESNEFDAAEIVTGEQAIDILKNYDMVVSYEENYIYNQYGFFINDTGRQITSMALTLAKTMLKLHQPEYVDVFDYVMGSCALYRCNMMITRKYVFDAYCEWLFSFLLEAHGEFMRMMPVEKLTVNQKRIFGYMSERLMNVWLLKNNLRLKELPIMENLEPKKESDDTIKNQKE